jgi:hypothetical protein
LVGALAVRVEASSIEELEARLREKLGEDVPSGSSVRIIINVKVEVRAFLFPRSVLKEVDEIVRRVREEASQYLDNVQVLASYSKVEERFEWGWWVGIYDIGIVVSGVAKSPISLIIAVVGLIVSLILIYFSIKEFRAVVEILAKTPGALTTFTTALGLGAGALLVLLLLLLIRELRR